MKKKCDHCHGKGGWEVKKLLISYFQPCTQCKGKGTWYTNHRLKKKRLEKSG